MVRIELLILTHNDMNKIKEWWLNLATDTKMVIVLLVVGIALVIWFCGIKGNNQDNFYYKGDKVAMIFPSRPNVPITKKSDAQVDTTQLHRGINIVKGKIVIRTT